MKVTRFLVPLLLLCAMPAMALTDSQVINYIKTQLAAGKSQEQIGKELLAQGVTPEQVKRVRAQYEKEQAGGSGTTTAGSFSESRSRDNVQEDNMTSESTTRPYDNQDFRQQTPQKSRIYGHDLFDSKELTFEPNSNMATPQNYRLGPGDEVIIDIWGASEDNIRQEISPDGRIMISQLGPVYLNGLTVAEANKQIKNVFAKKYSGVGSDTDINLTLGNVRSIQIDVLGEVRTPGTFRLSPFSNVFHALYNAGGINDIGSLRNIAVVRNGKKIANLDVYDYLFKGKDTGNVRLQEGDVVIVPTYSELVEVEGNVKRPMLYELKSDENLVKLLEYAGGFSGDAYSDVVRVTRQNGIEKELSTVTKNEYPSYLLRDGDLVTVGMVTDLFTNQVEINGSVYRPGKYAISDNMQTLRKLIETAEGLTDDAFLERAIIYREKPDRSMEVISVNLGDLMAGTTADIRLNKNDIITIMNANEIKELGDLSIQGLVKAPGQYPYADGMSLKDLIILAGGLREGASTARVDISRRIVDQNATDATNQLAETFTVNIENGLGVGAASEFILKPYDLVQVRQSPTYSPQQVMTVEGQVLYPGNYVVDQRNERVSEIIKRTGGLLESAYIKGAFLKRKVTDEEKAKLEETQRLAKAKSENDSDSISIEEVKINDYNTVGIDLEKAINNPGSTFDFVVKDGDILVVPELQSTVNIAGDVLYPNTVVYVPGKKLKYYIEQAGGYGERARKNKAYIVYMNGSVAQAKNSSVIEPGCQIIVPSKPETAGFDWTKVLSIATTLGSLASMTAAVAAIFRK
ncbi:MAG: SLBB domain-containing protein [Muribaculaceae bacterium]|nr:SLBB domain-containing protein [Muribaculaceae bacterium]